jgi:hypothetical protein
MNASSSPLQPDAPADQAAPGLTPDGRYLASVLAVGAFESGVTDQAIRRLFARCDELGIGLGADFTEGVLSELATLRAS